MALTKRQEETMEKHSKHHSKEHMKLMRSEMNKGRTFNQAHKKAKEKVNYSWLSGKVRL